MVVFVVKQRRYDRISLKRQHRPEEVGCHCWLSAIMGYGGRSKRGDDREKGVPFTEAFGMWNDRDIDIKAIRQKVRDRRTKTYGDDFL